ncbi:MAG TPA: PLDc N-terminal domain-containing protein [Chitinophagaceae bacterium]
MNRTSNIFYTILSLLPLVCFIIYMAAFFCVFSEFIGMVRQPEDLGAALLNSGAFIYLIAAGILMGLFTITALVVFIIHVINNRTLTDTEKILWVMICAFAGMIGFPVYWFMRGKNAGKTAGMHGS